MIPASAVLARNMYALALSASMRNEGERRKEERMSMNKDKGLIGSTSDHLKETTGILRGMKQWHSANSDVYHNNVNCRTGNSIKPEKLGQGTAGKPLCDECERLNTAGGPVGNLTNLYQFGTPASQASQHAAGLRPLPVRLSVCLAGKAIYEPLYFAARGSVFTCFSVMRGGVLKRRCKAGGHLQNACRAARGAYSGGGEVRAGAADHWSLSRARGVFDHVLFAAASPEGAAHARGGAYLHHNLLAFRGYPDSGDGGSVAGPLRGFERARCRTERRGRARGGRFRRIRRPHHLPLYRSVHRGGHHRAGHDHARPRPQVRLPDTLYSGGQQVYLRCDHRVRRDRGRALGVYLEHGDGHHAPPDRARQVGRPRRPGWRAVRHG